MLLINYWPKDIEYNGMYIVPTSSGRPERPDHKYQAGLPELNQDRARRVRQSQAMGSLMREAKRSVVRGGRELDDDDIRNNSKMIP